MHSLPCHARSITVPSSESKISVVCTNYDERKSHEELLSIASKHYPGAGVLHIKTANYITEHSLRGIGIGDLRRADSMSQYGYLFSESISIARNRLRYSCGRQLPSSVLRLQRISRSTGRCGCSCFRLSLLISRFSVISPVRVSEAVSTARFTPIPRRSRSAWCRSRGWRSCGPSTSVPAGSSATG